MVPQGIRDAKIIIFYKNKGSRLDCNDYRVFIFLRLLVKLLQE